MSLLAFAQIFHCQNIFETNIYAQKMVEIISLLMKYGLVSFCCHSSDSYGYHRRVYDFVILIFLCLFPIFFFFYVFITTYLLQLCFSLLIGGDLKNMA